MENKSTGLGSPTQTTHVAYRPGSNDLRRFASYEEAWRFTEAEFAAGNGVWTVETIKGAN